MSLRALQERINEDVGRCLAGDGPIRVADDATIRRNARIPPGGLNRYYGLVSGGKGWVRREHPAHSDRDELLNTCAHELGEWGNYDDDPAMKHIVTGIPSFACHGRCAGPAAEMIRNVRGVVNLFQSNPQEARRRYLCLRRERDYPDRDIAIVQRRRLLQRILDLAADERLIDQRYRVGKKGTLTVVKKAGRGSVGARRGRK